MYIDNILSFFIIVILIENSTPLKSPLKKKKKSESFESSEEIFSIDSDSDEINEKEINLINSQELQTHNLFQSEIIDKLNQEKMNRKYSHYTNLKLDNEKIERKNEMENLSEEQEILSDSVLSIPKESPRTEKEKTQKSSSKTENSFSSENTEKISKIESKISSKISSLKKSENLPPSKKRRFNQIQETPQNYKIKENEDFIILDHFKLMPEYKNNRIIANMINMFFVITGLYVLFLGIKAFKLLMVILQFYICYYFLLFFLSEFELYNYGSVLQQIGIFLFCIFLAFLLAIIFYFMEKINFIVFSIAVGSMLTLTYVQFFVDFTNNSDKVCLFFVYVGSSLVFSVYAFFFQTRAVIFGSVFVGAVIVPINLGVLFDDFKSFETRKNLPLDNYTDFINYIIIIFVLMILGSLTQFHIKRRIIRKNEDLEIEKANEEILADISQIN